MRSAVILGKQKENGKNPNIQTSLIVRCWVFFREVTIKVLQQHSKLVHHEQTWHASTLSATVQISSGMWLSQLKKVYKLVRF